MTKIKYISTLFVGILLFVSCNDDKFFELERPPAAPWQNINELESGAVAAYNRFFYGNWSDFYSQLRLLFTTMSDVVYLLPETSANVPYNEMYYRKTQVPDLDYTSGNFGRIYSAIGSANIVLDFISENDREPFANMTSKEKANIDRIEGEMRAIRAFSYYYLALTFAPVPGSPNYSSEEVLPLRLTYPQNNIEASTPDYVTTEKIYEVVVADLIKAKELLPELYDAQIHHASYAFGRINRYGAAAMLAKVYFQLGEFELAEAEIDYVAAGPFSLNQDPIESFNRDNQTQSDEAIWTAFYGDLLINQPPKNYTLMTKNPYDAINGGRGEGDFKRSTWNLWPLSHAISKQVGWMDDELNITDEARKDKRYEQLYYRFEGNRGNLFDDPSIYEMNWQHIKEPYIWGDKYFRARVGSGSNVPAIRLAELLLSRAIIRFNNNDLQGAADDLNEVRERSWDENWNKDADGNVITVDPYVDVAALEITADMIHNERIKELATEGDRLNYLRALRLPIPAGDRVDTQPVEFPYESLRWQLPTKELDYKQRAY